MANTIGASSQSKFYTDDCTVLEKQLSDSWKVKKKKSLGNSAAYYAPLIMKVKNHGESVIGDYKYNGNTNATLFLGW